MTTITLEVPDFTRGPSGGAHGRTRTAAAGSDRGPGERRYRQLFENAPIGILELDLATDPPTIVAANDRAGRLYGWTAEELLRRPVDELFADGAAGRLGSLLDAVRQGRTVDVETDHVRRDGETFVARLRLAPVTDSLAAGAILMVDDISAERRRRDDLAAIDLDRRRIAHEIHDGLAQNLYALRLRAVRWQALLDEDPERLRSELVVTVADLKEDIREARRAIFALRPVVLDESGLEASMRRLAAEMGQQYELSVALDVRGLTDDVPVALELPLLRVLQEALNNVGRHARATQVAVCLDLGAPDSVALTVRDNGTGFDAAIPALPDARAHYGLRQMRERVEAHSGSLSIESLPDRGTEIRVVLPLTTASP